MAPTTEQEGKFYSTRLRMRAATQRKYDDIFSCVVEKALSEASLRPATLRLTAFKNKVRKHATVESLPLKVRVRVEPKHGIRGSRSEDGARISRDELDDEGVAVSERKTSVRCHCGRFAQNHSKLHEHIVNEHPPSILAHCPECDVLEKVLRNNHMCRICDVYAECLEDHLRIHYQDRTGYGALMECRHCYRTFPTVQEVRLHERISHGTHRSRTLSRYLCDYCGLEFSSRHVRDGHLVSHFDKIIGNIWELVEQMQRRFTDQLMVNQCPICFSVMGSRKSFRLHIIQKHLTKSPQSFIDIISKPSFIKYPTARNETQLPSTTISATSSPVKYNLKEEPVQ